MFVLDWRRQILVHFSKILEHLTLVDNVVYMFHLSYGLLLEDLQSTVSLLFGVESLVHLAEVAYANDSLQFEIGVLRLVHLHSLVDTPHGRGTGLIILVVLVSRVEVRQVLYHLVGLIESGLDGLELVALVFEPVLLLLGGHVAVLTFSFNRTDLTQSVEVALGVGHESGDRSLRSMLVLVVVLLAAGLVDWTQASRVVLYYRHFSHSLVVGVLDCEPLWSLDIRADGARVTVHGINLKVGLASEVVHPSVQLSSWLLYHGSSHIS